jgi:hypothetical protein
MELTGKMPGKENSNTKEKKQKVSKNYIILIGNW